MVGQEAGRADDAGSWGGLGLAAESVVYGRQLAATTSGNRQRIANLESLRTIDTAIQVRHDPDSSSSSLVTESPQLRYVEVLHRSISQAESRKST